MKNRYKYIILIVLIVATGLKLYSYYYPKAKIIVGNNMFTVLVANTPTRQYYGLSNRDDLGKYDGMLFKFNESARYIFVMRQMNFALDFIWINQGKIVDLTYNAQPEPNTIEAKLTKYSPNNDVNWVLEAPAGFISKNGLKIGDNVSLLE